MGGRLFPWAKVKGDLPVAMRLKEMTSPSPTTNNPLGTYAASGVLLPCISKGPRAPLSSPKPEGGEMGRCSVKHALILPSFPVRFNWHFTEEIEFTS